MNIPDVYIKEIARHLDKKMKMVRSDRRGEGYGKYNKSRQWPGPFAKFLEKYSISIRYKMPGTPHQTGLAERCHCTLMKRLGV